MIFHQANWEEPLLLLQNKKGRVGYSLPKLNKDILSKIDKLDNLIPKKLKRDIISLPSLSEPQVIRHFNRLSQMNFGIDHGIYPLGSCTMKYNPKISERVCSNINLLNLHPLQNINSVQGLLEILYNLSNILAEITGMSKITLSPAAGAHGEFAGVLIIKSWINTNHGGETRDEILIPDSAHGTNPASASMAGFKTVKIPSNSDGLIDLEALKSVVSKRTAGLMMTNPNTLGLFEYDIEKIAQLVHDAGGLMYYDGANMNALLGKVRPGDMGFDIVHLNLHKTFSIPHGGGGPGAGPVGVTQELAKFLPIPVIDKLDNKYVLDYKVPKSIGQIRGFIGNTAHLVRAYVYIMSLGAEGLNQVSNHAVLASNYLLSKIDKSLYNLVGDKKRPRKHEFVISPNSNSNVKVRALDVGKALLDYGIHSPTMYFPINVPEALMIEPTETESMESLDNYAEVLNEIGAKLLKGSSKKLLPENTTVGRLDEVKASHPQTMKLNWREI